MYNVIFVHTVQVYVCGACTCIIVCCMCVSVCHIIVYIVYIF